MNEKTAQYIDISKFPPDERPHIIDLATQFNALVADVNQISGDTAEEKEDMWRMFKTMQVLSHYLGTGSPKVNAAIAAIIFAATMYGLERLGVDTHQVGPQVWKFVTGFISGGT